jgi:hypothetical protein
MSIAITTRSYDNSRSGAHTRELSLTPAAIRDRGLRHLFSLALPGDARGCEAQPLIVPGVVVKDGSVHDIVYVATMANQVFAFDANTGARLWKVQLGPPINGSLAIDEHLINDHWGILSTPVIDTLSSLMYLCVWTSADQTWQNGQHFLHAIRLKDGSDAHPPLNLEASTYDPGYGRPIQTFRSSERKQRAALLLVNGAVFIAFGALAETAQSARGWLIAVDTVHFQVSATWAATALGCGGGIWQSGAGPAADSEGNIYVLTGNGDFDGVTDFGESMVKLRYTAPRGYSPGTLKVVDWWTPWADQDFGSAGPVLAPSIGAILASNKDGILYTGNMHDLGKTMPADLDPSQTANNYAKLKTSPIFYTYYPGPRPSPAPSGNRTHHLHGTPVVWQSATHGLMHFCWGENGNLRAWVLSNNGESVYLACSAEVASVEAPAPLGGMAGGMISLSANGNRDGVIWASISYGDANMKVSPGRFLAYDAAHFGTYSDGSGSIPPLWDSQAWNWRFSHNKFNRPIVWNGRVYLPTYDGEIWVLGLA